jgi:hypothetical protein
MTNAQHPSFDSSQPSQQTLELGVLERVFANAVADRVADLLSSQLRSVDLVDAATLATALNVSRDWVYAHSAELGGIRIGPGNRGRLRFDLGRVLDIWRASERTGQGARFSALITRGLSESDGSLRRRKASYSRFANPEDGGDGRCSGECPRGVLY